jgi:hypothetical protein
MSQHTQLLMSRSEAEKQIQLQIDRGYELLNFVVFNEEGLQKARQEKKKWSDRNERLTKQMADTGELFDIYHVSAGSFSYLGPPPFEVQVHEFRSSIKSYITRLESIKGQLDLLPESPMVSHEEGSNVIVERTASELERHRKPFQILDGRLDEEDLRTLCFSLEIDYDDLSATGKRNKLRELLIDLENRERIDELIETVKWLRPDILWD